MHAAAPPLRAPAIVRSWTIVVLCALGMAAAWSPAAEAAPRAGGVAPLQWLDAGGPPAASGGAWGVPWARGTVRREQRLAVRGADGLPIPTQSWPLAFWPDGSVKWSGVAIAATPGMPAPTDVVPVDDAPLPTALVVTQDADAVTIATGTMTCRIPRQGSDLIASLMVDGREVARHGRLVVRREDRSRADADRIVRDEESVSRLTAVTVEQAGPVRAVVHLTGMHAVGGSGRAWLPFSVRLYATAGQSALRIVHSLVYDGDPDQDFIRALGISFAVPFREERQNRHVRFATDAGGVWGEPVVMSPGYRAALVKDAEALERDQLAGRRIPDLGQLAPETRRQFESIAAWDSFSLDQLAPDAFSLSKRTGSRSSWLHALSGHRAGGLVFVGDVSGGLAVGVRHFWEKFPSALEVSGATTAEATLNIWFWAPDAPAMDLRHYDTVGHDGTISYEDHEDGFSTPVGVANTSELTVWACGGTPAAAELADRARVASAPPLLVCPPSYYHDVGAFGAWSLPDRGHPDRAAIEDQLDRARAFFAGEVERRHWYGFWDFGDFMRTYDPLRHVWMYDVGGHAWNNTELMADAWLWYDFLRTGRADAFRLAEAMTRNTSEVDVYHLGRFAGIGSRHNVSHWGCGAKELRISESFLKRFSYYLTTDERLGDLMRETLTADERLPNALPLRKKMPRPGVALPIRTGPDWTALVSDWFTEWERTGDTAYRDRVLAGMASLGAMPEAFAARSAFAFDLKTKTFADIGEPNLPASEFMALFGGDQILDEALQSLDCPTFATAWHGTQSTWARAAPDGSYTKVRALAATARRDGDPALGRKAWDMLRASLLVKGRERFPAPTAPGAAVDAAQDFAVDTPGTAQWALSLILGMEAARDFYVPPPDAAR